MKQYSHHIFLLLCMCTLILSWCNKPETANSDTATIDTHQASEKQQISWEELTSFRIDTSSVWDISWQASLTKTWKIEGKSNITVSAQANGRVSTISHKEWDVLTKWHSIIWLTDTYWNLSFTTQKAKEALDSAKLAYESNEVSISNTLIDLQHNVKKAQQAVDTATINITQQEKDKVLQRLDFDQQRLDAQQQLEDSEQQLKDMEQQLADGEQQLKDSEQQLKDSQEQLADSEQQLADSEQQIKDSEQQIRDSEAQRLQNTYNATTNDPDGSVWSARLQLDKFDSDIQKAEFDYQTRIEADTQTLEWFISSSEILKNNVSSTYRTVIDEADKILWVTSLNQYANASYEQYLWALNTQTKRDAQDILRNLISQQTALNQINFSTVPIDSLSSNLSTLTTQLDTLDILLQSLDTVLLNSVTAWAFPQSQLDALKARVDGLEAQVQWQDSNITQQVNQINAFLRTYKQNQDSLAKSIEILMEQRTVLEQQLRDWAVSAQFGAQRADIWSERIEIATKRSEISATRTQIWANRTQIAATRAEIAAKRTQIWTLRTEIAKKRTEIGVIRSQIWVERNEIWISRAEIWIEKEEIALQNALETALLNLESAQNAVNAQLKNKKTSLKTLQNNIDQALVSYNETLANVEKLTSKAPVWWTIGSLLVDLWQEVTVWTPLYTISDTRLQEIIIYLSSAEKDTVTLWSTVSVTTWGGESGETYSGRIQSISDIADDQLLYKTTVYLDVIRDRLWDVVTVQIPIAWSNLMIPLSLIHMIGDDTGTIWMWNWQRAEEITVRTGRVRNNMIEIVSWLSRDSEIITSSMSTYNPSIHDISPTSVNEKNL